MNLSGKKIILGVSGGIAAYKAAELLRRFQKSGAEVRVCMTSSATRFIGAETFAALSKHPVATEVFSDASSSELGWTKHIAWAEWADIMVIAPCTANTLAKVAHGLSDNLLSSTVLALRGALLICPTMDGEMYEAPSVQRNLQIVSDYGYHILEPESGFLASGLEGKGRLPEYDRIIEKTSDILSKSDEETPLFLKGKKVLVTAGPTREHFDPVRYLSNPSSGKMGFAMAEAAIKAGAEVSLYHGPVHIPYPTSLAERKEFTSADDLFDLVKTFHPHFDIIIMAAAVSDWKPSSILENKAKKEDHVSFDWIPTPDILAWLGLNRNQRQTLIGFAMESDNVLENAKKKLLRKKVDWILANSLQQNDESVFNADINEIIAVSAKKNFAFKGSKKAISFSILHQIFG